MAWDNTQAKNLLSGRRTGLWSKPQVRSVTTTALVASLGLLATGCLNSGVDETEQSISSAEAAQELIVGPLAEQAALGVVTASCPDFTGAAAGSTFTCTATNEAAQIVNVVATVTSTGQVEMATTNVIVASALPSFEEAAVDALNQSVEVSLSYADIDCGEVTVVLGADQTMTCGLRDPLTDAIFDVALTVADIETRQFGLVVADSPRR